MMISGTIAMLLLSFSVSPAWAHNKYRTNLSGPPRKILVEHSHETSELAEPQAQTPVKAESKGFHPIKDVLGTAGGAVKAIGRTLNALWGGKAETEKIADTPQKTGQYRYVPRHYGGNPRRIRKYTD